MSVKLMGQVFEAKFKHPSEKWVMIVLANYANDDGCNAYPSVATIARSAGISDRAVQLALRNLAADGLIVQDGVWQSINGPIPRYRILVDKLPTGETASPVKPVHPVKPLREGVKPFHPTGEMVALTGEMVSPNPLITIREPSVPGREPAAAGAPPLSEHLSDESSLSEHPAVKLWLGQLKPKVKTATSHFKTIADHIGTAPEGLNRWQDVLRLWAQEDYNPNNVEGLLSRYDKATRTAERERAGQSRPASRQGSGRQSKGGTFRREQCPPRNGLQGEIDALRRNAKNYRDRGDHAGAGRMEAEADKLTAQLALIAQP